MSSKYIPEKRHEDYVFFKARGICPNCRKHRAENGFTVCRECAEQQRRRNARGYDPDKYLRKRETRIKKGLCANCGREKPVPGITLCEGCRQRKNSYYWKVKNEKPAGTCRRQECGCPAVPGKAYCPVHLKRKQEICAHMQAVVKARQPGSRQEG